MKYFGTGTQRLEEELYKIFPESKIIRMYARGMSNKDIHDQIEEIYGEVK